jgi:phosphate transport system protein
MSRHFHRDVENLHRQILSLSAQVEEMIDRAGQALCEGEHTQAEQVIQADDRIDEREVQIEEECLKMLALHQPVAIDLRRIATVLKIDNDLERIADLAVNIAERAQALHERPDFPIPSKLERMFLMATEMVRGALRAYVDCDAEAALRICERDDDVDQLNRDIIADLVELMQRKPPWIDPALHCFSAVRHLERIADHAVSIAEDVVYLVSGEIVRHRRRTE